jgi:ADP-sugar diphosphatase
MSEFTLDDFGDPVPVILTDNITREQLLSFPAFITWRTALKQNLQNQKRDGHPFNDNPFSLKKITIQSVDWAGNRVLFVKLIADIVDSENKSLPGIAFLRGGSVAVLMILQPNDMRNDRMVIMTEQARIPAGSLAFKEIPAGMMDDQRTFAGAAANEIEEETHLKIRQEDLIDLTELALRGAPDDHELLQPTMYPSPGGSDEFIAIFLWRKEVDRSEIEQLRDKYTGLRKKGELIKLYLCDYEDVWRVGARDAKTLAAWALYEALNRSGVLEEEIRKREEEKLKSLYVPVEEGG